MASVALRSARRGEVAMNPLLGIVLRENHHQNDSLKTGGMLSQMVGSCRESAEFTWCDGYCGLAVLAGVGGERQTMGHAVDQDPAYVIASGARVDNREEIGRALGIPASELRTTADESLISQSYAAWGESCTERLYGDWSFAVWHPKERRLFLARDHFGISSLYYHVDRNIFAFASTPKPLLALKQISTKIDELFLAQRLTSWSPDGFRTIHSGISRLPPAHRLTVTPDKLYLRQYWYLEKTPMLRLPKRQEYVEAFSEVFDDAVRCRLRPISAVDGKGVAIAATLSGGLDSSSVAATAAKLLSQEGRRLTAYTAVPYFDTKKYLITWFGDEFPFAQATSRAAGNVDLKAIDAINCTPIRAIRWMLEVLNEPVHAAGNAFWILELWKAALADGNDVLLLGQFGNAGVSWTGDVFSQSIPFQLRQLGWRKWLRELLKRNLPPRVLAESRLRRTDSLQQYRATAINPAFAGRLNLLERRYNDSREQPARSALDLRSFLEPGRNAGGAFYAELGAAFGLDVRDPTADARVLAFTYSVPDHVFIDPRSGLDRWLIREAMKGRLPDEVRLNRNRGRQAADLVPRLRASAGEVEMALNELADGPAGDYVDVPYMRRVWQMIQLQDSPEALRKSGSILIRGIMAGLFVDGFYK